MFIFIYLFIFICVVCLTVLQITQIIDIASNDAIITK
jgi:hypothetical protein